MKVTAPTGGFTIHTSSTATVNVPAGKQVLINRNGALIKSGTVNIDSETKVTVENYIIK